MKSVRFNSLASLVMAVALTIGLAACGGGSDTKPPAETGPTLAERQAAQQSAIDTASTAVTTALANLSGSMPTQAQVDALNTAVMQLSMAITAAVDVSDSAKGTANGQLAFAQNAATTAQAHIDATARAGRAMEQQSAINMASAAVGAALTELGDPEMATHTDQALVDALDEAIMELDEAITAAVDVDDLTDANAALTAARAAAMTAQTHVTTSRTEEMNTQQAAIDSALAHVHVAVTAIEGAGDTPTQDQVDDLASAIAMLSAAIDGAAYVADLADARATLAAAMATMMTAQDTADDNMSEAAQEQMAAIATASEAVSTAQDALDDPPTQAQVDALESAIGMLEEAIEGADEVSEADLRPANALVTLAKSAHMMAQAAYDAKVKADRIAAQKVLNAAAILVRDAIVDHTLTPGPTIAGAAATGGVATISRTSGDAKISLNQTTPVTSANKYSSTTAPSAGTGWAGVKFSRESMSGKRPVTEMAVVYTDIEMAGDIAWTNAALGELSTGFTVTDATGAVAIAANTEVDAVRLGGAILPSAPPADDDDGTTREIAANGRVGGTFYGVSGQFACGGTACTVTRTSEGMVSSDQELTFTPTSTAVSSLMAKYADPDGEYTHFGYWMKSTTLRNDTMSHDIETFHGGIGLLSGEATAGDGDATLTPVQGDATYYGAAAGVYVKMDGAGDSLVVSNGEFTADAMLTARFGGSSIAVDDQFEVEGTISDFMDGSTELGFADLVLRKADMSSPDLNADPVVRPGTFSGETDGGGTSGNWSGQFWGNANPGNDNADASAPDLTNDFPTDVSGEFNGHFTDGHVAGAFGAERDE